jgi:nucleoid-associated protein YgaU
MTKSRHSHVSASVVLALLGIAGAASAQEACTTYVVKEGDTLGSIAQAAYGSYDYQMIFNANRDKLAASINSIEVGLELLLPCEDGRLTAELSRRKKKNRPQTAQKPLHMSRRSSL